MARTLVYLDNGATTRTDTRVAAAALEVMTEAYGNPSSGHAMGKDAKARIMHAREQVARAIGADPEEITFTSGGTESNALGVLGAAHVPARASHHVVVSGLEHSSVSQACAQLAKIGFDVTWVKPQSNGVISPADFAAAIRPDTAVATIMWVQNEIGTVQPIAEIATLLKARAPHCHFHVDGVQAVGKIKVDLSQVHVDSLSLSGHKIHGPKGIGALYVSNQAQLSPLTFGGGQERGLRPGTENVPGIVALGVAVELAESLRETTSARLVQLRDDLHRRVARYFPRVLRHGDPTRLAPHILSLGFPDVVAEMLLYALEERGVCASSGSACRSLDPRPSPTMTALGVPDNVGTLRFSLSRETTAEEIVHAADMIGDALASLGIELAS